MQFKRGTINSSHVEIQQPDAPQCIACEGKLSFLGKHRQYTYATCNTCRSVQLAPIPKAEFVETYYRDSKFSSEVHENTDPDGMRGSSRPYYVAIEKVLADYKTRGTVVDFGAGWGGLCEYLISCGYQCRGLELSKLQVEECRKRSLPVEQRSLSSLVSSGVRAEALVLSGVFEHLTDPVSFFRDANALLEDGGLLVSLQPTATFAQLIAWCCRLGSTSRPLPTLFGIFDAPWHVVLYSLEGMKLFAEKHGFELVEIRPAPQGRVKGFYGVIQFLAGIINVIGWAGVCSAWPLVTSHTFVFRKRPFLAGNCGGPKCPEPLI
ncbi:MAG: class I SAM-dependent methyltransferase [Terriglobia bacterium]